MKLKTKSVETFTVTSEKVILHSLTSEEVEALLLEYFQIPKDKGSVDFDVSTGGYLRGAVVAMKEVEVKATRKELD